MPKYEVEFHQTRIFTRTIKADSEEEAVILAFNEPVDLEDEDGKLWEGEWNIGPQLDKARA
jgi:hypothetical protein